ncbi:MAG: tRNA preQ1(34) S-adenosylmethionine ribosyltransferase-isomerase QueA [Candidatus Omnitrophica bacterium]|nr:tRNA preQ1(34) S-adenosylmethionine ribosyltransferase-isomerase QueA [Candidatus Omnitrophota bacterium]
MKLTDFDYNLPKELIAQYPSEAREESRLLVLHRETGKIEHRIFRDIVGYFNQGDFLALNNTKVVPARLVGRKQSGGKIEALVLFGEGCPPAVAGEVSLASRRSRGPLAERVKDECEVLLKPTRGCKIGSKLIFGDGELKAEVSMIENGRRFLRFECNGNFEKLLDKFGKMPLPPYIKREPVDSDRDRYQTVYADKKGAVAAPTAGLHFTKDILSQISRKGVDVDYVTLHVGYGTFKPVKVEDITAHKMEEEYFEIDKKVIEKLKNKKQRTIAVGTTTCRALETVFSEPLAYHGWTDLFIYPPREFKRVDALLTNFHLPRTTLLMLVSAFCGRELLMKAYEEAIRERYRFYSYGDAMLIL